MINVELSKEEIMQLVLFLGDLPNKSNSYALAVKLSQILQDIQKEEEE